MWGRDKIVVYVILSTYPSTTIKNDRSHSNYLYSIIICKRSCCRTPDWLWHTLFLLVTWHPICSPPPQGVVVGALIKVLFPSHCQDDPGRQDPLLSESLEFYLEFLELFGIFTSSLLKRIILFYKIVRFDVSATPYWIPSIHLFSGSRQRVGVHKQAVQTFKFKPFQVINIMVDIGSLPSIQVLVKEKKSWRRHGKLLPYN